MSLRAALSSLSFEPRVRSVERRPMPNTEPNVRCNRGPMHSRRDAIKKHDFHAPAMSAFEDLVTFHTLRRSATAAATACARGVGTWVTSGSRPSPGWPSPPVKTPPSCESPGASASVQWGGGAAMRRSPSLSSQRRCHLRGGGKEVCRPSAPHRHTDTQTHRLTDAQTHRRTDAQTHRHTDTQTHGRTDTHPRPSLGDPG